MHDIRVSGGTLLPLMALRGIFIRRNQLADIVLPVIRQNLGDNHVYGIGLVMKIRHSPHTPSVFVYFVCRFCISRSYFSLPVKLYECIL